MKGSDPNMEQTIKSLNEFLANLNIFYRKLQNYHWNIIGEHFFVIHEKLEEYYNEINDQIDEIAEHILILGYQPIGTIKGYLEISKITEAEDAKIQTNAVINGTIEGLNTLKQKAIEIKKMADDNSLYETSSLMDEYMSNYSKKIWILNQTIQ